MNPIAQNKGKDISKVPNSKLVDRPYYYSVKYDGFYTQIAYNGKDAVRFWTSGGKEFYLVDMAEYIKSEFDEPFHVECEYTYGCEGKLGDRSYSARLTTYRTNFGKLKLDKGNKFYDNFYVLDMLDMPESNFANRLKRLNKLFRIKEWFLVPDQIIVSLADGRNRAKMSVKHGYEGGMLKSPDHIYQPGKRTNDIIKLKMRKTADLLCVGYTEGEGKYKGMIGSLLLRDFDGRTVNVGSGLSDEDRAKSHLSYYGKVIEIEYERVEYTYIQPTIIQVREDKDPTEID